MGQINDLNFGLSTLSFTYLWYLHEVLNVLLIGLILLLIVGPILDTARVRVN